MPFTDQQFAELLTVLKPLADLATLMIQDRKRVNAPNLTRPLADYDTFDFETQIPGCLVIARDRDNFPTEVEYDGRVYRRYRSAEDDVKGRDIRYRCVVSGTVAEKNMVWATLIAFREPKKVRDLNSSVKAGIAEGKATRQATAATQRDSVAPAMTPVQPAVDPVTQAAEALGGKVRTEPAPELVRARAELAKLNSDAIDAGIEVPYSAIGRVDDDVAMTYTRASTLRNLLEAHKRSGAPPAVAIGPTVTASASIGAGKPTPEIGEAVVMELQRIASRSAARRTTPGQDGQIVATLNELCLGDENRHAFIKAVFLKDSYKDLLPGQRSALFTWLMPSTKDGKPISCNMNALAGVACVLAYADAQKEPAGVPA
jgi:hypothetical protein